MFLHTVSEDMDKYEYLEQLSLVSLAVWKAECRLQIPLGLGTATTRSDTSRMIGKTRKLMCKSPMQEVLWWLRCDHF
jgi:hypothetical protein